MNTMLTEIAKLRAVRAIGLPPGLSGDVAPGVLAGWRARAAVESLSHLRRDQPALTLTLDAAEVPVRSTTPAMALVKVPVPKLALTVPAFKM